MIILFLKSQLALFDMPVRIGAHVRKDGTVVKPHTRIVRAKPKPQKIRQQSLFADAPAAPAKRTRLDIFINRHGGAAGLDRKLSSLTKDQRNTIYEAMADLGKKTVEDIKAMLSVDQAPAVERGQSLDLFSDGVQPEPKPKPEEKEPEPADDEIVEHVTKRGKTLRGVIRHDLTYAEAKEIDEYTFKKDGGYFIRERHLGGAQTTKTEPVTQKEKTTKPKPKAAPKPTPTVVEPQSEVVPNPLEFGVQAGVSKAERRNINARVVDLLTEDKTEYTEDDKALLRQYSGNGGCGDSLNEFYTDPEVAAAMWSLLGRLGVSGGDVLEPSCATGVFMHTAPADVKVTGVELDPISAKAAEVLHGNRHEIVNASLERFATQDGSRQFDAVIGNAPFGLRGSLLKDDKPNLKTAEGYFLDTALDKTKAGGVVAMIVPTGVLDTKSGRSVRERLLRKGQFLGAVRMPNTAFEHSHTEVTTDIVFFRKRPDDVAQALMTLKQDKLKELGVWDEDYLSGAYFEGRGSHNVFGTMEPGWRAKAGIGQDITVSGSMIGVPESIEKWVPDDAPPPSPTMQDILNALGDDETAKQRALGAATKRPYDTAKVGDTKVVDGVTYILQGRPPRWHRVDEFMQDDAVSVAQGIAADIDKLLNGQDVDRANVEARVRAYVEKYGNPGDNPNLQLAASQDKTLYRLIGAVSADGTLSDAVAGRAERRIESNLNTAANSLALANVEGVFTPSELAKRTGKDVDEVEDALFASDAYAYVGDGQWTTMDLYLTGELWAKLDHANESVARGDLRDGLAEKYTFQAKRLEETIDPKSLEDVEIMINSAFLPPHIIAAYFNEKKNTGESSSWAREQPDYEITYEDGLYTVKGGLYNSGLLDKYLNRTGVRKDDMPTIDGWNEDFKLWLLTSEYRDEVEELYNRKFRGFVQRDFSNEPIDIPGLNTEGLKDYQYGGLRWALSAGKGIIAADVGLGKAQPLDAKILTPNGWVLMGDISVGDQVMSVDGKPTVVTGVYPQGEKEIFKVVFSDGSSTECCEEHLWLTQTHLERNNERRKCSDLGVPKVRTLDEIRKTMTYRGMKNHAIPMVAPVEFDYQDVPLDPYLIGALLGDGSTGRRIPQLTSMDKDIVVACGLGLPFGVIFNEYKKSGRAITYNITRRNTRTIEFNEVGVKLKEMGLDCLSSAKFVPDVYKFNSIDVRLAVLRGLMDTDGYVSKDGVTVQFSSCSEKLAGDVQFLAQSLGGTATIKTKTPKYRHKGEVREGRLSYIVHLRMPPEINPFFCERKFDRVKPKAKYKPVRYIVGVEPVGRKPAQCISVDNPSRLYVTDDFIVTHNTVRGLMLARMAKVNGTAKKPTFVVPKSVLANWVAEADKWFPGSRVMVIGETYSKDKDGSLKSKTDTAAERNRKLHELTQNDYDFVFMSLPAFNDLDVDPITKGEYVNDDFWVQRGDKLGNAGDKRLNRIRSAYDQAIADREFQKRTDAIYFNDLGIDMLVVDEGHAFKNLYAARSRFGESPKFLGGQGLSNRALDMNMKTRWVREQNDGKNVFMLTATPTKNSPLEIYSMLSHISPEAFERIGIRNSEEFLDRFCEFQSDKILGTDGTIQDALVTVGFKNMGELREIMSRYIDRKTAADVGLALPERDDHMHMVDMSPEQLSVYEELRQQMAESAKKKDSTGDAHVFSIMDKMAKAAMDLELLGDEYKGSKSPKYTAAAKQIVDGVKEGGQVVFSESVQSHEKMADALVEAGIPRDQIAIINATAANTSAKRQNIADAFNSGKIKVVIGNKTMEEGINLQKSTTDIHHLDLPWEPASMQQRNGRGLRQGNLNEAVRIHTYISKGSFDGYRYQSMMAKKDWQDLLWSGGDRVENMAREGTFDRSDLLIMMSADPEAERAKFEADKAAAQERYDTEQRSAAAAEFVRFQAMRRSFNELKDKGTASANRLRNRIERAKTMLSNNKHFTAKAALLSDKPVVIHPQSGIALQQGVGIDLRDADGNKEKWVVDSVSFDTGDVTLRRYAHTGGGQSKIRLPVSQLGDGVTSFKYDSAAEASEVSKKLEASAIDKANSLSSWDDIKALPSSVIAANNDKIQQQIKEGTKVYSFSMPYGDVAMIDRSTGEPKVIESYYHNKRHDTHDYMLPTDDNRQKAIAAYVADRLERRIDSEYYSPRKHSRMQTRYVERFPGGKNQNRWESAGKTVFGDDFKDEANRTFLKLQRKRIRQAGNFADALNEAAPTVQYNHGSPRWDDRVLAMLYVKAKNSGVLDSNFNEAREGASRMSSRLISSGANHTVHNGSSVLDALVAQARSQGNTKLAAAMLASSANKENIKEVAKKVYGMGFSKDSSVNDAIRHLVSKFPELGEMTPAQLGDRGIVSNLSYDQRNAPISQYLKEKAV